MGVYDGFSGERLLASNRGFSADHLQLSSIRVVPGARGRVTPPVSASADFDGLRMLGYGATDAGNDSQTKSYVRGDWLSLDLFWQTTGTPAQDYAFAVCLARTPNMAGEIASGSVGSPEHPTSRWTEGEVIRNKKRLLLDYPAGEYRLLVSAAPNSKSPADCRHPAAVEIPLSIRPGS
jgi:hypothetical protein